LSEKKLEEIPIREAACCLACNYCRDGCPTSRHMGIPVPQLIPTTRVLAASHSKRVVGPRTPSLMSFSDDLLSSLNLCVGCGYCKEVCPNGLDFPSLVEQSRYYLMKRGLKPPQTFESIPADIANVNNPYGRPLEERDLWLGELGSKLSKDARTVLFQGCTPSYMMRGIAISAAELLLSADKEFRVLGKEEPCCGAILKRIGYIDEAREQARRNVAVLRDADEVIFPCAACYRSFKIEYPEMGVDLPFKPVHMVEVLDELIKDGKLRLGSIEMIATYHDPCSLGRYARVFDPPRSVLRSIPGLKLVETYPAREASWCCGGEHLRMLYSKHSLDVALDKIQLARRVGAEAIVTACPLCSMNFKDALKTVRGKTLLKELFGGAGMEIYDVAEVVMRSVRKAKRRK